MQRAANRAHWLAGASFLFVGLAIANWPAHAQTLDSTNVRAVPTYESAGIYWSSPGTSTDCSVQFRKAGDAAWTQGLNLWYDAAKNECRGSLVSLTPGTSYEAQLGVGSSFTKGVTFTTWSNTKPVASTVTVASGTSTLNITQGGSASGYVVYDGTGSTLDAQNGSAVNISINASYVIVRGFTLKGAQQHGILIDKNQHDVIIEDNDISGWGRTRDGTYGTDMDSGIRAICTNEELTHVTVQRNRIHDPRYPTNSWDTAHPAGAQAITFSYCGGENVYRWNEFDGGANHFNDCIGGEDNYSTGGFPNKDSDVYGNICQNSWDDGLEIEGGNMNVRVWGNYVNNTGTGISSTLTSVGPLYIFRNVWNRNQFVQGASCDADQRQPMFKSGSSSDFANGRRYLFHNTMLQATQSGCSYGLGGGAGVGGTGDTQLVHNTVSMNNIYHLWKPNGIGYQLGSDNTFQNDMYSGNAGIAVISGINAIPTYAAGNGWQSEDGGAYALAAGTPGYDGAVRIPNFNDSFVGIAPDVGAAEAGAPAMKFGVAASDSTPTTDPAPAPAPAPAPSPTPTSASFTMDSSSYTLNVGQGVTFTARIIGSGATPTGTFTFKSSGNAISGCGAMPVSNGQALCTTTALTAGTFQITADYSGDPSYYAGVAGPITETVNGPVALQLTIDSTSYTSSVGQPVTFTVRLTGGIAPTGTIRFTDGSATIAGCGAVTLASGTAACTTTSLSRGNHKVRGYYSGDSNNGAGVAGPITQKVN